MELDNEKPDNNVKSTIDAVTGLVREVPIYQDAIQPAAKQLGKSLETVTKLVNIALAPIAATVWGYEKIAIYLEEAVSKRLKDVPEENIVSPPPYVAGPAVEALKFAGHNEQLRELYANLIAAAMNKQTRQLTHPSYIEVIKNLSPEEAVMLQIFKKNKYSGIHSLDVAAVDVRQSEDKEWGPIMRVYKDISFLCENASEKDYMYYSISINNLYRVGIFQTNEHFIAGEDDYDRLIKSPMVVSIIKAIEARGYKAQLIKRGLILSSFGAGFVNFVVDDKIVN